MLVTTNAQVPLKGCNQRFFVPFFVLFQRFHEQEHEHPISQTQHVVGIADSKQTLVIWDEKLHSE